LSFKAPSAWRGRFADAQVASCGRQEREARKVGLVSRVGREVMAHPAETVALVAMTVAAARLLARKERPISLPSGGNRRKASRLAPIGLMAAICLMMIAGCGLLPTPVVSVAPDPLTFGRTYADDMVVAGEKLARERCIACHPVSGKGGRDRAPPLDTLVGLRGSDQLADDLVAGLPIDHGNMPRFDFNVTAAIALVAYLEAIAPQAPPKP